MIIEDLSTLKIHKLTQEQYERELAAGRIEENALYLTPDEGVDLSDYATKDEIPDALSDLTDDATHRLVTDAEKTSWNAKAEVSAIPIVDQTIDKSSNNAISNKAVAKELEGKMGAAGNTVNHTGQINFFATGEWVWEGETPNFFIKLGENNVIELVCHDSKGANSIMIG